MALNFPASPTLGQQFENWVWDGTTWNFAETLPGGLPAGSIIPWAGANAPVNWLLCDGSAVSRSTYSSLFAVIGTAYGAGNGTTTFNLPDLRGRIPVGRNGGSFGTLGATGGVETVTLTEAQMPSHTHTQNAHNHTQNPHTHNLRRGNDGTARIEEIAYSSGGNPQTSNVGVFSTTATNNETTATNQNTGGGEAHTNVQPYQVVNYIIKATAASTPGDSELATRVQPVTLGGTGTTSLTAGNYLKGNGTDAIVTQTGVPATDLTGTINASRLPNIPVDIGGTGSTTGSGLIPVVPSSVSVGSGSASVNSFGLITLSGTSSISINNVFSSTFKVYRINIRLKQNGSGSTGVNTQFRTAGTNDTNGYFWSGYISYIASTAFQQYRGNDVASFLSGFANTSSISSGVVDVFYPFENNEITSFHTQSLGSDGNYFGLNNSGFQSTASSFDGITFFATAGTWNGTIQVYGYR